MRGLAWHRGAAFVRELIPGGRAWQRVSALAESSRLGRRARDDHVVKNYYLNCDTVSVMQDSRT